MESAPGRDHRRAARHGLDHAEPERLLERDQVQQGTRAAQHRPSFVGSDGADVSDAIAVDVRLHGTLEVLAILDDAGDDQRHPDARGHVDRLGRALVRMDAPEEQEVVPRGSHERERVHPDAVVDRGLVAEPRMTIGVADRDVVAAVAVSLEDRDDLLRREPVDRGDDGRVHQPAVGERQEVEVVVDQVELRGVLEHGGDVQALPYLGVQLRVLRVTGGDRADQGRGRERVGGGEQRHVHPALDQPLGQERDELLPRAVVARRHPPRDGGQHRETERRARHDDASARSRSEDVARTDTGELAVIDDDRTAEHHVIGSLPG